MPDLKSEDFQKKVSHLIIRNQNVVDILTKCQSACSKICRSSIKTATGCGCLEINATKKLASVSSDEMTGISGTLCPECREIIENEIGEMLFYIAGLCNAFGLSMRDIMKKEIKNIEVLGKYSLR
ncbi:MAG: DUF1573 domain-containing protein [Clostridia bacterium]|nr:DUF1573 domain-containing protein [Clostridia bacterium]